MAETKTTSLFYRTAQVAAVVIHICQRVPDYQSFDPLAEVVRRN